MFSKENTDRLPTLDSLPYPHINDLNVTTSGIVSLLQDLKVHKACGPDGIFPCLLEETALTVAPMLTLLYQASLNQYQVPSDWKQAFLVFKKGDCTCPTNYRPTSLTCIPCNMSFMAIYSNI